MPLSRERYQNSLNSVIARALSESNLSFPSEVIYFLVTYVEIVTQMEWNTFNLRKISEILSTVCKCPPNYLYVRGASHFDLGFSRFRNFMFNGVTRRGAPLMVLDK